MQGVRPRWMHLALDQGDLTSLKVGDYAAYERQARRALGTFIAADPGHNPPTDPYPEPGGALRDLPLGRTPVHAI